MADILLQELPPFEFVKEDGEQGLDVYSIQFRQPFSEEEMSLFVDRLDLNGASCIFHGDKKVQIQSLILWRLAIKLRSQYFYLQIPQRELEQTSTEKRAFNGKKELTKLEELNCLIKQRRKHWIYQAMFITKWVSNKHKIYPNMFVINTAYNSLLKGWKEKKLIHETIFMKVLFFIELCDQLLLKNQELNEKTEEVIRLVLKDLPTVSQTPAATFENILFFFSFCTRFHLNTLQKGQEERFALQVLRSLLTKIVQLNRNSLRTKNLMNKYLAKLNNLIPNCPPTHYVFNQLQSMEREAIFQREE